MEGKPLRITPPTPLLSVIATCLAVCAPPCFGQIEAVTKARYDLKLGFTVGGKVGRIHVKPGDTIQKDDLLMELEDEEGKSLVELYKLRANSELGLLSAQAALRLAQVEEKAIRTAYTKDAATPIEVERAEIRTTQAQLEVRMARQTGEETKLQLEQAKSRHEQYLLRAPTDGIVDLLSVEVGELVESLKPVLRQVVIDPLWIDAAVPLSQTLALKTGDPAWVRIDLAGREKTAKGKIVHLALIADAASETRLVRIEMPNPQLTPAGGHVTVWFDPPDHTATAKPSPGSEARR